jgi:hypothetical protein
MAYIILANEWDRNDDPVRFFFDNGVCLDLNHQGYKPRTVIFELSRRSMNDCVHNISYDVVICEQA